MLNKCSKMPITPCIKPKGRVLLITHMMVGIKPLFDIFWSRKSTTEMVRQKYFNSVA